VQDAVEAHTDYIKAETLSLSLTRSEFPPPGGTDVDLNGSPCAIRVDARV
jgi:hypothetical protein